MLTTIGWIIAFVLLTLAVGTYVFFRYLYVPTDLFGLGEQGRAVIAHMNYDMQERLVRSRRTSDLRRLEQDLNDAERLMALEARRQTLATQYAERSTHSRRRSRQTEGSLKEIAKNIERLKRG